MMKNAVVAHTKWTFDEVHVMWVWSLALSKAWTQPPSLALIMQSDVEHHLPVARVSIYTTYSPKNANSDYL